MRSRLVSRFIRAGVALVAAAATVAVTASAPAAAAPTQASSLWPMIELPPSSIGEKGSLGDDTCQPGTPAHPRPYPVVLLHGLFGAGVDNMPVLYQYFTNLGYCVWAPTYGMYSSTDPNVPAAISDLSGAFGFPLGGLTDPQTSAQDIAGYIKQILANTHAGKVDVLGHSEGGFEALYLAKYAAKLGLTSTSSTGQTTSDINSVVTLAPDTYGTSVHQLLTLVDGLLTGLSPSLVSEVENFVRTQCVACINLINIPGPTPSKGAAIAALDNGNIAVPGTQYTVIVSANDELVDEDAAMINDSSSPSNVTNQEVQFTCGSNPLSNPFSVIPPSYKVGHIGLAFRTAPIIMAAHAFSSTDPGPSSSDCWGSLLTGFVPPDALYASLMSDI